MALNKNVLTTCAANEEVTPEKTQLNSKPFQFVDPAAPGNPLQRTRPSVLERHQSESTTQGEQGSTEKKAGATAKKRVLPLDEEKNSSIPYKTRNAVEKDFVHDVSYVMFDIETGGLKYWRCDLQISAICSTNEFDIYVKPERPIDSGASAVNKLTQVQGNLFYQGNLVHSIPIEDALKKFVDFLENIHKPVLVGHNIKKFDLPFLGFYLKKFGFWKKFVTAVAGFVDTWILFRQEYPGRSSCKQVDLVAGLLGETYEAHNAMEDVKAVQKLCELVKDKLWDNRFGVGAIVI